jgi:hypothetical protein
MQNQPAVKKNRLTAFLAIFSRKFEFSRLLPWVEVGLIIAWALWVTRIYANLDVNMWPNPGEDFPFEILWVHNWSWLLKCGACVLWNGSLNGGAPMLPDMFTAILHPALVLPVLIWGGLNGAKIILILSAILAGLAQWWLAKVLRLGLIARLWVSFIAVIGGHLWARAEFGDFASTFSAAASSLLFAPLLDLAMNGRRLSVVALGVMMASAMLSGHGYMQLAILFGALPPMAVFLFDSRLSLRPVWRSFATAALITVLLTALWWLPLIFFWPNITKSTDVSFSLAQQNVLYSLLNLIINDDTFMRTAILGKAAPLSLYSNYISWVPVAFCVAALSRARGKDWRVVAYFLLAIWLIYLTSTTWIFQKLNPFIGDYFGFGRDPSLIVPLAVPLILGLAAWGFDGLLKLPWPSISISNPSGGGARIGLRWLILIPALWAIYSVNSLTSNWHVLNRVMDTSPLVQAARTKTTQWITPPGMNPFTPQLIYSGLKLITPADYTVWGWGAERTNPEPYMVLTANPIEASNPGYEGNVLGINILKMDNNEYASIQTGNQKFPCDAYAQAGNIDVVCETTEAGILTVYENNLSGWSVYRDQKATELLPGNRLQVVAPAGDHRYQFRYRPWEVTAGFVLSLMGGALIGLILWRKYRKNALGARQ